MRAFLERHPGFRGWLLLFALVLLAAAAGFTIAGRTTSWLALLFLPSGLAMLWTSGTTALYLAFFSMPVFVAAFLLAPPPGRAGAWSQLGVMSLVLLLFFLLRNRLEADILLHQEEVSKQDELLIQLREQYRIELVLTTSNRKKIEKYTRLHKVAHTFGAQLQLERLTWTILQEVQELFGSERGTYQLALCDANSDPVLHRALPETPPNPAVLHDAYGEWVVQHRTSLLITDTQDDFRFKAPESGVTVRSLMVAPLLAEGRVTGVLRAESPQAETFSSDDLRLFTVVSDLAAAVVENAKLYQRAQELAITDGLTGLYLRRYFNQRFQEELLRYQEHETPFTLLLMDLDHFKRINDQYGHLAGDQILAQLAGILKSKARVADVPCRFGGEEFALILPNTSVEGGLRMAERIRTTIAEQPFRAAEEELRLTVSIGVGECPADGRTQDDLVRYTDQALYAAKQQGRNRSVAAGAAGSGRLA